MALISRLKKKWRIERRDIAKLLLIPASAGLTMLVSSGTASVSAQQPPPLLPASPPSHIVVFQVEASGPAQYDEELSVLDFEPGAWTYERSHGGMAFYSVVDGNMTLLKDGGETQYARGQSFRLDPMVYYSLGNKSTAKARVILTTLTSPGLSLEANHPDAKRPAKLPVTAFTGRATLSTVPARFTLNQAIFEFRPGAGSGAHVHPSGQGVQIVMSGRQRHRLLGADVIQGPGDVFVDMPNRAVSHEQVGPEPMVDVVSYVFYGTPAAVPASIPGVPPLPAAPAAASPAPPITPPSTGDGGLLIESPAAEAGLSGR